jgi:hypothetical protein
MRAITIVCLSCLLLSATAWAAQTPSQKPQAPPPAATADLPPELAMVPPDAATFIHLHVDKLFGHPVMKHLQPKQLWELMPEPFDSFLVQQFKFQDWGLEIPDLASCTLFFQMTATLPPDMRGGIIFVCKKPYDRQKLLKGLAKDAEEKKAGDKVYYVPKIDGGFFRMRFHFIDDRRLLLILGMSFGEENPKLAELVLADAYQKKGKGPLTEAIAAAKDQLFVMGAYSTEEMRKLAAQAEQSEELSWMEPMNQYDTYVWTLRLDKTSQVRLQYRYPDAARAKDAEDGIKHGQKYLLQLLELPLAEMQDRVKKNKDSDDLAKPALVLLLEVQTMLKTAQVQLRDKELTVVLSFRTDDATLEQVGKFIAAWKKTKKDRLR